MNIENIKKKIEPYVTEANQMIAKYRDADFWALNLFDRYGIRALVELEYGVGVILEETRMAIFEIENDRKIKTLNKTHVSILPSYLPELYEKRYTLTFLRKFESAIERFMKNIREDPNYMCHSVAEELIVRMSCKITNDHHDDDLTDNKYLGCLNTAEELVDEMYHEEYRTSEKEYDDEETEADRLFYLFGRRDWQYDWFDDDDVEMCLYDEFYGEMTEDIIYHFSHWFEDQFHMD